MAQRVLVAIPVFNEERYIDGVLDEVRTLTDDVLAIDDGSTDRTGELLRKRQDVAVVTHHENRGYGMSIASAFAYARCRGYDWLVTMDCDEQHKSSYIPKFMEIARQGTAGQGTADIVSGTRYPEGFDHAGDAPPDRRRINAQVTRLINQTLGLRITDAFCGFKAYRVAALEHLHITVPGYAMPMQFWVQVARAGLRVVELAVPLIYNDPNRHFGGLLDDPQIRLAHYLQVFETERRSAGEPVSDECASVACKYA